MTASRIVFIDDEPYVAFDSRSDMLDHVDRELSWYMDTRRVGDDLDYCVFDIAEHVAIDASEVTGEVTVTDEDEDDEPTPLPESVWACIEYLIRENTDWRTVASDYIDNELTKCARDRIESTIQLMREDGYVPSVVTAGEDDEISWVDEFFEFLPSRRNEDRHRDPYGRDDGTYTDVYIRYHADEGWGELVAIGESGYVLAQDTEVDPTRGTLGLDDEGLTWQESDIEDIISRAVADYLADRDDE